MTAVFRVGLLRFCGRNSSIGGAAGVTGLLNVQSSLPTSLNQKCNIMGRMMRGGPRIPKCKPWPYKEKSYNVFTTIYDKTSKRFDENSKMICVEGPIGACKTAFAKELAEELDMLYVPQADMDMIYINPYGYDMRQLDPKLPENCRSYDVKKFCQDPHNKLAAQFQIRMYMLRYEQYVDALAHILSTGQGVVMDRCCYSDFVFLETMHKHGYISKAARYVYNEIRLNTITELLKPHLVIYLDLPVDVVKQRIKQRGIDYEVNSKVFTTEYLRDMEIIYKQQFLKQISEHAEILIYDWTAGTETEVVVEDIERIDFDQFEVDHHNKKMKDWRFPLETEWADARLQYTANRADLMNYFNVPLYNAPELIRDGESAKIFRDVWYNAPGMKYREGYNSDMGDKNLLFKTHVGVYDKN